MKNFFLISLLSVISLYGNQTPDVTPVLVNQPLPFKLTIQLADFKLPLGIHSAASGRCGDEYLFITGRTNGLHNFSSTIPNNNFPPNKQNTCVFVINFKERSVRTRSLHDPKSGLNQEQIDFLSVTSAQSYQRKDTLYITGGYGINTRTQAFSTKPVLTAIDVPGLIHWVTHPESCDVASKYIRQIFNEVFQVTGGSMVQVGDNPTLLMMGQNFSGYYTPSSNGNYTQQIRRFKIIDDGKKLDVKIYQATPQDSNYRRRDLNIVPIIEIKDQKKVASLVALSGVFTPGEDAGIWTVPIEITANGQPSMANPNLPDTFKQAMNNYYSANAEFLSDNGDMYIALFGGITYGHFKDDMFLTSESFPFTNQVTIVKRSKDGIYEQYFVKTTYPKILSNGSNLGNELLFGVGAKFLIKQGIPVYSNGVINLAKIRKKTVIGYIVGGIQSTLPDTDSPSDSAASPYIFEVILTPNFC